MPLVAREGEMESVVGRLREHRLVTIVGPGGIGKTALARAAAEIVGPEFAYGALTADLTRVDDPASVKELIAGQFGVADFQSLINSPSDQPALLVIDNCEHVLDAAAEAIDMILASCRMPTVLATSRSPLDVAEEVVVPLAPLEVPPADHDGGDVGAVRMFTTRVADFGGRVRPEDAAVVAEICRRLDGVPLALEIAAARSRTSTLAGILREIDDRPSDLSRPKFRGRRAHRSVSGMVEWSLDLLDAVPRHAFEQLGVIAGPFDLAMANAVVAGSDRDAVDAIDISSIMDELVGASLVVADTSGAGVWYRQLHPVRAVALDRLRRAGGESAATDRAVDYVVELATRFVIESSEGWSDQLGSLLAMYDNMVASLRWSNEHDERPDRPLTLLAVLWGVVHQAHTAEVAAVGETVLERWTDTSFPFWADGAATVATCRNLLGRHDEAIELATNALENAGASPFAPGSLRRVIAQAHRACGRLEDARDWFAAGADAAGTTGAHGLAMELRVDHALLVSELGDGDLALAVVDEVVEEAERRGAPINLAWALSARGAILFRMHGSDAIDAIEHALDYSKSIGYPAGVSFGLRTMAAASLASDHRQRAAGALLELLFSLLERGGLNDLRMVLDHTAVLLERVGDDRWLDAAATAQALPVTTVGTAVTSTVFEWAGGRGTVLPTRDAYALCRTALTPIAEGEQPVDPPVVRPPGDAVPADVNALTREGDTWRFTFDGTSVVMKASKGMSDLARLLASPGQEISAMDLMGSTKTGGLIEETLDGRARRELTERIRELQAEVDEAEAYNDLMRADRAAAEMDRLVDELSAAVGLGGRARTTGSDQERARSAVTQRVRSTIGRIALHAPALARHLSNSVETGTFCVYRPTEPTSWVIER
jgi:predicted ATPase